MLLVLFCTFRQTSDFFCTRNTWPHETGHIECSTETCIFFYFFPHSLKEMPPDSRVKTSLQKASDDI